jgi:hypothetical protein
MEPREFTERMKSIAEPHHADEEAQHGNADDLMCEVLRSLGYEEGVRLFEEMPKWYA